MNSEKRNTDLISVVVPVYNAEDRLNECINSILKQSYSNIEIILVDDGSTDSSFTICKNFKKLDDRIVLIHKTNEGAGRARNAGIEVAKGKYICFCDSDDYVDKNWIEVLYSGLQLGVDLSVCGFTYVDNDDHHYCGQLPEIKLFESEALWYLFKLGLITPPFNKLYRKEILYEKHIRFGTDIAGEDLLFNLDYLEAIETGIAVSDAKLYAYYQNPKSITHKYNPNMWRDGLKRMRRLQEVIIKGGIPSNQFEREFTSLKIDFIERNLVNIFRKKANAITIINEMNQVIKDKRTKKVVLQADERDKSKIIKMIEAMNFSSVSGVIVFIYYMGKNKVALRRK